MYFSIELSIFVCFENRSLPTSVLKIPYLHELNWLEVKSPGGVFIILLLVAPAASGYAFSIPALTNPLRVGAKFPFKDLHFSLQ